jgi:hypothetical protein
LSPLSGFFLSVHGNLASVKDGRFVCVNWSVRHAPAATADLVSLIGESDSVCIHEKWAAGLAD